MILLEIHREAKQRTRDKAKKHSKRIFLIGGIVSSLLTFAFYSVGLVQNDPLYHSMPWGLASGLVAMQSFNAVVITQLVIMYFKSASEYTASKAMDGVSKFNAKSILRNEEEFNTMSEAIHKNLKKFGKQDFELQIDEAKKGLRNENKTRRHDTGGACTGARVASEYEQLQNRCRQRVSTADEAEQLIVEGWQYVGTLPNGKVVVKKGAR